MKTFKIKALFFMVILCSIFLISNSCSRQEKNPYLDVALEAAGWIESSAVSSEQGILWPAVPDENTTTDNWLYSGNSGIIRQEMSSISMPLSQGPTFSSVR